jgi:DNA-binding response OmpR family regulator
LITRKTSETDAIEIDLRQHGYTLSAISFNDIEMDELPPRTPDMVIIEVSGRVPTPKSLNMITRMKKKTTLPVLALTHKDYMDSIITLNKVDDFVLLPYEKDELILRIRRLLQKVKNIESSDLIKSDGLTIDHAKNEDTLENRVIELTFKEYELLLYLAGNKGRVFTRESLLNKVWGYDYFGGDRTVDVHIRRLRSKIEDPEHTFIETVRNIGYRFKKNSEK